MTGKVDEIVYRACELVEALSPEERYSAGLQLLTLIRAVERAHLGPDERVFCLREQDKAAIAAIDAWAESAAKLLAPAWKVANARETSDEWRSWQEEHPTRAKVPD